MIWIGKLFKRYSFFCPDGTAWKVGKKISEKEITCDPDLYDQKLDTSEAQAVYHCRQIIGPSVGHRAIFKVRLQITEDENPSPDPKIRAKDASTAYGRCTRHEVDALQKLTERGCSVTPRLLQFMVTNQDANYFPVPGGWMIYLVMEKVPGVPLREFWSYDLAKREKIRQSFRRSFIEFNEHGASQFDTRLGNLIYDENQDKCYFIDFEDVYMDLKRRPISLSPELIECYCEIWNLAEEKPELEEPMEEAQEF